MAEENLYTPNCIRTFTGLYMNVFDPKSEMICIEDIAHALAQQPRFGGHLPRMYSVAQHSVNCSFLADSFEDKLTALLHDASEAYICDIPRPIKSGLTNYKEIEHKLMHALSYCFGFEYPLPESIKKIDEQMLNCEWHYLMLKNESWKFNICDESESEKKFLDMFHYYNREIKKMNMLRKIKTEHYL